MIAALLLLVTLAAPTFEQNPQSTPKSPCPNVFQYEPPGSESGSPRRWYGVVNLSTDNTLHSLWLNIELDRKADILGNYIGEVTTTDNINFKIENTTMKIRPGPATALRFFVQYSSLDGTPRLKAIRLNGREICNANTPQPAVDRPDVVDRPTNGRRPDTSSSRPSSRPVPEIRDQDRPYTRPVESRPIESDINRPVYVRPDNSPNPVSINGGDASQNIGNQGRPNNGNQGRPDNGNQGRPDNGNQGRPNNGYALTTIAPGRGPVVEEDVSTSGDNDDYFGGGTPTFIINDNKSGPTNPNIRGSQTIQCGKVVMNNPIPLVVNGTPTLEGQWPWQIALYQTQTIDNKYLCGGTLVSHRHVITAAHCVTRKKSRRAVDKNTLTIYLGKHNLRTSVVGVQIKFVGNIFVHPEYNATTYSRDVAVLELRDPVTYTDWVRPACLWPENEVDLRHVIGKKGSVVGWGFDETGVATEELSLVEMPIVNQETCLRSYSEFFVRFTSSYTYCAGYRDGVYDEKTGITRSTSVCNGDSGGGMVFNNGGTWYLRGLVSLSVARQNEYRCDPSHYVIFTDLAKFLPWIKQIVNDY